MKKISLRKIKKYVIYAKKAFSTDDDNKVGDYCHYTGNIEELLIVFVI